MKIVEKNTKGNKTTAADKFQTSTTNKSIAFAKSVIDTYNSNPDIKKTLLKYNIKLEKADDMSKHIESNPKLAEHVAMLGRKYAGKKFTDSDLRIEIAKAESLFGDNSIEANNNVDQDSVEGDSSD